jgi:hypothetical protein
MAHLRCNVCRYKVRTEIAKKQKDAETRQAVLNGSAATSAGSNSPAVPQSAVYGSALSGPLERAMTLGTIDNHAQMGEGSVHAGDEIARLQATLAEQELKWKKLYETVAKENEVLRSKGGESLLATQWRNRYEGCMKEKEELLEKLDMYSSWTNAVNNSGKSMEQAYIELQEDFSSFRKKVAAIDRRRQRATASVALSAAAGEGLPGALGTESELTALLKEYEAHRAGSYSAVTSGSGGTPRVTGRSSVTAGGAQTGNDDDGGEHAGMTASKIKYVRHMVFQYLSCREPEVRTHMETALMTIFRMTAEEREVIENRRKEEATDTLSSLTSFLGSLGT